MKRGGVFVLIAVVLVLVVTGALAGLGVSRGSDLSSRASERTRVVSLAGQYAVDYSSLDYRHLQADAQAEIKNATSAFATRYRATVQLLTPLFAKNKYVVKGSVALAGLRSLTPTAAVVLIALDQKISSSATTFPTEKLVRMQVSLSKLGGRWLVSDVAQI